MAAEVTVKGGTVEVGQVRPLFAATQMTQRNPLYEVSADGQHFLLRTYPVRGTTWLKTPDTSTGASSRDTHSRSQDWANPLCRAQETCTMHSQRPKSEIPAERCRPVPSGSSREVTGW
jgi:hypothetical protein